MKAVGYKLVTCKGTYLQHDKPATKTAQTRLRATLKRDIEAWGGS